MFLLNNEIYNLTSSKSSKYDEDSIKNEELQPISQVSLLEAVIENFVDGILVLTDKGELIHGNECARNICNKLTKNKDFLHKIPEKIWGVCQSLINSYMRSPEEKIFAESQIDVEDTTKLRVRVRWLSMDVPEVEVANNTSKSQGLLLVTLEDSSQVSKSLAITDARKYHLTAREAEVWLLRRANLSYQEIADKLYITINTVKKHLKNIYAKQQEVMC